MKDFVQPVIDLIKVILERPKGTKFLTFLISVGAIVYLHTQGMGALWIDAIIGGMMISYMIADIVYKKTTYKKEDLKDEITTTDSDSGPADGQ